MVRPGAGHARAAAIYMPEDSCKVELPRRRKQEKPIPSVYPVLDTDLARDNVENDIPAADLEDL